MLAQIFRQNYRWDVALEALSSSSTGQSASRDVKSERRGAVVQPSPGDSEAGRLVLRSISFEALEGSLTVICGPVASGKSSLLSAILGEMIESPEVVGSELANGPSVVRGRTVYVPQQAWILYGTFRENITFGLPYDSVRFKVCRPASGAHAAFILFPCRRKCNHHILLFSVCAFICISLSVCSYLKSF